VLIKNDTYSLLINDCDGSIESLCNQKKEFIHKGTAKRPLFTIRFRDSKGILEDLSAIDACQVSIERIDSSMSVIVKIRYENLGNLPIHVNVEVVCPHNETLTYWNLSVEHDTDRYIDWVDFPDIVVPNDLIAAGGSGRVLWSGMEGVLIEDADLRESFPWMKYSPVEYPSKGWEGYYPGPCPTQCMAYYDKDGGLYFGAHDEKCNVKAIEFYKYDGGIRLEYRLFPGALGRGKYKMEYNMVLGVFSGDWYDAVDIYRNWALNSDMGKMPKLSHNEKLPRWLLESPVVAIYPIRGHQDIGDMTPNSEYYPYSNAIPYIDKLSEAFDSKIMALIMQWEGTAPWAPPYVWPPFGGEDLFKKFVDGLHEKGNLAGVYCSGIGWTNESILLPEYNRWSQFEEQNLKEIMCTSPEGTVPNSLICNGTIRWGHDMCPENRFVEDIVVGEVSNIINSGCDYIQYFDQNLGGGSYFCYGKNHGHPSAPGLWQINAMRRIYQKLDEVIKESGREVAIGCESAAAEPYIQHLLFNDLRFSGNLLFGKPVPVYAYVYHEYINNFMGNQCGAGVVFDLEKSPENLLLRTAYSFIAGDLIAVALGENGEIIWGWNTEWDTDKPNQEAVSKLIGNLNSWRKNEGKPFLCFGRMEKPYNINGIYDMEFKRLSGKHLIYPSLLTSRWISQDGRNAQIIVNYMLESQNFTLRVDQLYINKVSQPEIKEVKVYTNPKVYSPKCKKTWENELELNIEPLSAIMVEFC